MKLIKVVFLTNGKLPKTIKSYSYKIDDSTFSSILMSNGNVNPAYEIVNNAGFNYHHSKVIFVAYKYVDNNSPPKESQAWSTITKVTPKGAVDLNNDPNFEKLKDEFNNLSKEWNVAGITSSNSVSTINTNTGISSGNLILNNGQWMWNDGTVTVPNTGTTGWVSNYPTYDEINDIKRRLDKIENKNEKENKKMFESLTKNLKCGRAQDVRMSIYGPAFKGEDGNWYAVGTDDTLTDVSDLLFDIDSYCYMMPVAKNQVKEGDFILHNGRWTKVISVDKERVDGALDIFKKEFIVPVLTKSPFGFEFYTKLVPLVDFSKLQADANTPFGALPMILMMNKNDKDMLPFLMMGMQSGLNFDMSNPMMMYFLMKDGGNDTLLPFLMMQQTNKAND